MNINSIVDSPPTDSCAQRAQEKRSRLGIPATMPLLALLVAGTLVAGCATQRDDGGERYLDRKGAQVLSVLGTYLFPPTWDESTKVRIARGMYPLEYHGNTTMGKTLIQSLIMMEDQALATLLADVRKHTSSFRKTEDIEHAFGVDSDNSFDEQGLRRQLSWWRPDEHPDASYYAWGNTVPPRKRVWLQVSDEQYGEKRVYIRIEME